MSDDTTDREQQERERSEAGQADAVVPTELDAAATVPNEVPGDVPELSGPNSSNDEVIAADDAESITAGSDDSAAAASDVEPADGGSADESEEPEELTPKQKAIASVAAAVATISPEPAPSTRRTRRKDRTFYVVGFWRRSLAALIDVCAVVPLALALIWVSSRVAGLELPASNHQGPDYWLDLFLANHPALIGGLGLLVGIGALYVLIFQITMGRTLGMLALKTRIIDLYGDPPSSTRAIARTAGYLAGFATLSLGFLWIGFDSEKRGLHDWLSGTYVVKA